MKKLYWCTNQDLDEDKRNGLSGGILVAESRVLLALAWQWYYKGEKMTLEGDDEFTIISAELSQNIDTAREQYDINDPSRESVFYDATCGKFRTESWITHYGFSPEDERFIPTVVFNRDCVSTHGGPINLYDVLTAKPHEDIVVPYAFDGRRAYTYDWADGSMTSMMLKVYIGLHGVASRSQIHLFEEGLARIRVLSKVRVSTKAMYIRVNTTYACPVGTIGSTRDFAEKVLQDNKEKMGAKHPEWKECTVADVRFIYGNLTSLHEGRTFPPQYAFPGVVEVTAYKSTEDYERGETNQTNRRYVWFNFVGNTDIAFTNVTRGSAIIDGESKMANWVTWAVDCFMRNGCRTSDYFKIDLSRRDRGENPIERQLFDEFNDAATEKWVAYPNHKDFPGTYDIPGVGPHAKFIADRIIFTLRLYDFDQWVQRFSINLKELIATGAVTLMHREAAIGEILIKPKDYDAYLNALPDDVDKDLCSFIIREYNRDVIVGNDRYVDHDTGACCYYGPLSPTRSSMLVINRVLDKGFEFRDVTQVVIP